MNLDILEFADGVKAIMRGEKSESAHNITKSFNVGTYAKKVVMEALGDKIKISGDFELNAVLFAVLLYKRYSDLRQYTITASGANGENSKDVTIDAMPLMLENEIKSLDIANPNEIKIKTNKFEIIYNSAADAILINAKSLNEAAEMFDFLAGMLFPFFTARKRVNKLEVDYMFDIKKISQVKVGKDARREGQLKCNIKANGVQAGIKVVPFFV